MSSYSEEDIVKLPEPEYTWDTTSELALYQALLIHKPAGINKHFSVAMVSEKLTEQLGKPVLASAIWKKLRSMFDLRAVEDREESIPFSLEVKEFSLPRREFETLILERRRDWRGGDRSRAGFHLFSSQTPEDSRSSPIHKDSFTENSEFEDDDLDSDLDSEDDVDENYDNVEVDSTKSDSRLDDEDIKESDKEDLLIAQAREEIEKKLKDKLKEEEREVKSIKGTPKPSGRSEPRTPREDEKFLTKRHITRSTPNTTPSSTPNKRRK